MDQLQQEKQKVQQSRAREKKEKEQPQEELNEKSHDLVFLNRFLGDFLYDPAGSASMLTFLRNNRDYMIDFGRVLEMISCSFRSDDIPILRSVNGDNLPEIIHKVDPSPDWLRFARAEGMVILEVEIDKEGNVRCPCIIYGRPLFNGYAWEAVIQWKYRPYLINGIPSRVRFAVTVPFKMGTE
jgi:hypothetical protein